MVLKNFEAKSILVRRNECYMNQAMSLNLVVHHSWGYYVPNPYPNRRSPQTLSHANLASRGLSRLKWCQGQTDGRLKCCVTLAYVPIEEDSPTYGTM